jgi:hypothetical protein
MNLKSIKDSEKLLHNISHIIDYYCLAYYLNILIEGTQQYIVVLLY